MNEYVKPCPFCGSIGEITTSSDHAWTQCSNPDCGCSGGISTTITGAIDKWNKRLDGVK